MMENMSDNESINMDLQEESYSSQSTQPVKIRKKPGRKPNPASPALRKAQNRAAQRAFRERKERHMRELEVAIKQIRDQRDKLHVENEQMKTEQEIMRSENWYLKGIVLTLQLVCFQHNLVIPQHGPYINEQALSVLAQSIPESISTYISVNASNKLPVPSKLFGYRHTMKQRDRFLSSNSIVVTKNGVHSVPETSIPQHQQQDNSSSAPGKESRRQCETTSDESYYTDFPTDQNPVHPLEDDEPSSTYNNMPPLSPVSVDSEPEPSTASSTHENSGKLSDLLNNSSPGIPKPVMLTEETLSSNLAAIQALRLRLRIQSACVRMDALPFTIQPTILQLTIPHDPRIDLIPTPHMRDRMILFRDQFDLDDCFRCLLGHSVFHGGDPAVAANWQLPPEFFEKYWFLTIDYDLRRTTNHWRRLQGLDELNFQKQKQQNNQQEQEQQATSIPSLEKQKKDSKVDYSDLSALLGIDFWKIAQETHTSSIPGQPNLFEPNYASSLSSDSGSSNSASSPSQHSPSSPVLEEDSTPSFEPVRLMEGHSLSFTKPQIISAKKQMHPKSSPIHRHHPYQKPTTRPLSPPTGALEDNTCDPWDTLLTDASSIHPNYDLMMENLIDTDTIFQT